MRGEGRERAGSGRWEEPGSGRWCEQETQRLGSLRTPPASHFYCHHILRRPHQREPRGRGGPVGRWLWALSPGGRGQPVQRGELRLGGRRDSAKAVLPSLLSPQGRVRGRRMGSGPSHHRPRADQGSCPPAPISPASPGWSRRAHHSVRVTLDQHASGKRHFPMEMHPAGEPALSNALARTLEPLHMLRCKIKHFLLKRVITLPGVWYRRPGGCGRCEQHWLNWPDSINQKGFAQAESRSHQKNT